MKAQSPIGMLGEIPLFRGCTKEELRRIDRAATQADFPPAHVICREGAPGRELLLITNGEASVERGGVEIAVAGPGDFIGEMSLLDGGPRSATVTTRTSVTALVLPAREFWEILDEVPALGHKLLATLATRLRAANDAAY